MKFLIEFLTQIFVISTLMKNILVASLSVKIYLDTLKEIKPFVHLGFSG